MLVITFGAMPVVIPNRCSVTSYEVEGGYAVSSLHAAATQKH